MGNLDNYQVTDEVVSDFTPLPVDKYLASIVEAELKQTKAGTGSYINVKFEVMDGKFKGRWVFTMITFTNPNSVAQEIGRKQLNTLLQAIGYGVGQGIQDTSELTGHAVVIEVGIEQNEGYAPKNTVKNYFSANAQGAVPVAPSAPAPTAAPVQPSAAPSESNDASPSWAQ